MKGVSGIIVVILLLMISISLAGFGYIFFTTMFSTLTTESEEVVSTTVERMLAQMKIESIDAQNVYVRNTGKVDLTGFGVYVNDALVGIAVDPGTIVPGTVGTITLTAAPASGDTVKVTTAQGALAVQTAP